MKTTLKFSLILLTSSLFCTSLYANEREELREAKHLEQEALREEKRAAHMAQKIEKHKERIRARMETKGRSYEEVEAHLTHLFGES